MTTADMTTDQLNRAVHKIVEPDGCVGYPGSTGGVTYGPCTDCGAEISWLGHRIPDYTTDLNATLKVVEHCRKLWKEQNPHETQLFKFTDCCEHGWRVDIEWGHHDGDIPVAFATDDSLPKAICLAIIAAMGDQNDN